MPGQASFGRVHERVGRPSKSDRNLVETFPALTFGNSLLQDSHLVISFSTHAALVVDDHPMMVEVLDGLLRSFGFASVDHAASATAALDRLRDRTYAVVISDWNMEPISGLELLRTIREDPELRRTRFIMTSANSQSFRRVAAHEAGADAYLVKPFRPQALRQKIESILMPCAEHPTAG